MVTECKDDGLHDLQQNLLQEVHRDENVMTDGHEQQHLDGGVTIFDYHIKRNGEGDMNLHCVVYVVIDFPDQEA